VFAILGLRALYFLLAGVIDKFHFLKLGLSVVLVFVGVKMLLTDIYPVPIGISLVFIAIVIATSVVASLIWPKAAEEHTPLDMDEHTPLDSDATGD
jgi:tellurite resistance protein TerC